MKTILIVAMTRGRLIGAGGKLPWHEPDDLRFFKRTTTGHAVIMGRRTFESIGRALPGRRNVVVSGTMGRPEGVIAEGTTLDVVRTIADALRLCRERGEERAIVIGGAQLYAAALPLADEMIVTWIEREDVSGDTYFPAWDAAEWVEAGGDLAGRWRVVTYRRSTA